MNIFKHFDTLNKIKVVLIALCAALSIAQIAMQDVSLKRLRSESDRGWWFQAYPGSPTYILEYVPAHIDWAVNNLLIAASAFCFAAAFVAFCKIVHDHGNKTQHVKENDPKEPAPTTTLPEGVRHLLTWDLIQFCATILAAVLTLLAFIHTFVQLYRSSTWYYSDSISSESWFTLESWVCQLQDVVPDRPWLHKQCRMALAGRWLSLPLLLSAVGLAVLSILEWRRNRLMVKNSDEKTGLDDSTNEVGRHVV